MGTTHDAAAPAAAPGVWPAIFGKAAPALRAIARRIEDWRARRLRRAIDHDLLAGMSERELRDIGLGRGNMREIANGAWRRDDMLGRY